jgi:hypothetical protein
VSRPPADAAVLALGIYLVDREHRASGIARELAESRDWAVEQRWIALGRSPVPAALEAVTAFRQASPKGKFVLLNRLLAGVDLARYAYVLVVDDDIDLPRGFVDEYLGHVERYELALAQPARTHESYVDHWFVARQEGLVARRTRFVEIGPVFSMRRDVARLLTPFSEVSPMGWGFDQVWPLVLEEAGLRMGIVDATPVAHDLRKPVAFYDNREAVHAMRSYLAGRAYLTLPEAFHIVEAYP